MDKQLVTRRRHETRAKKSQTISIVEVRDTLISVDYPYNAEFTAELLKQQDELLVQQYHRFHSRLPQLLIYLNGISEIGSDCKSYIQSKAHQDLYESVAFILSKGNMSVLERHYLQQLYINQPQASFKSLKSAYSIGVFPATEPAQLWLKSKPGSNYQY